MTICEYKQYAEQEILPLYTSVGRTAYTDHPELLRKGFENSMLTLAAYEDDQLLGISRVSWRWYRTQMLRSLGSLYESGWSGVL